MCLKCITYVAYIWLQKLTIHWLPRLNNIPVAPVSAYVYYSYICSIAIIAVLSFGMMVSRPPAQT